MLRNRIEKVASYAPAPPDNGMRRTRNHGASYQSWSVRAADAGRYAASCGESIIAARGRYMFCPKCGTQNSEDQGFCRGCGENLSLVLQALGRNPSLLIAHKLDWAVRNHPTVQLTWLKNQKRRAAGEMLSGAVTLLALVWFILLGRGNPEFAYGIIAAVACYLMALGVWDLWGASKTSEAASAEDAAGAVRGQAAAKELAAPDTSEIVPVTSITESTTRKLKEPGRRR